MLAPEIGFAEFVLLDHRAHGAVEHQDPLQRSRLKGFARFFSRRPSCHSGGLLFEFRAKPQKMADRIDEIGAVHRVEMKFPDAVIDEIENLFGGDRRGDELSRLRIIVEPFETIGEPLRNTGTGSLREILPFAGNFAPARCLA